MPNVIYIVIGVFSFLVACSYDWLSLKNIPFVKQLAGLLAVGLNIYATVMVCISPAKFDVPFYFLVLGACLLPVSLSLLMYSLFIEIPFRSTYLKNGVGSKLITTGTYALTRHPGVLWLALFYLSLAMLFPSTTLFLAITIWLIMDIIYVIMQDRIFFIRMFLDYNGYRRRTPFLIPTKQSILACFKTINSRDKTKKV
jgi:protein-S-isoprenylcysteine O-methyltransferase Ste14